MVKTFLSESRVIDSLTCSFTQVVSLDNSLSDFLRRRYDTRRHRILYDWHGTTPWTVSRGQVSAHVSVDFLSCGSCVQGGKFVPNEFVSNYKRHVNCGQVGLSVNVFIGLCHRIPLFFVYYGILFTYLWFEISWVYYPYITVPLYIIYY